MSVLPLKRTVSMLLLGLYFALINAQQTKAATEEATENLAILRRRAHSGLPAAQYMLGNVYMTGDGAPEDTAEAAKWFRKAGEQGYAEAQFNLGMMYYEGVGVPMDKTEAVKWYSSAAQRGVAEAQYNLAICFSRGDGVTQNHTEAFKWYLSAAESWDTRAQVQVGLGYRDGIGVKQNESEAIKWLRRAAYQNDPGAQYALALIYANTASPFHNEEDAKRWMKRSAELGYSLALAAQSGQINQPASASIQAETAKSLAGRQGEGSIGTNAPTSNRGSDPALHTGTINHPTTELKFAESGVAEAQWKMALAHLLGENGESELKEAIPWLEKAAAQKHARAEALLNKLNNFRGEASTNMLLSQPLQPAQVAAAPAAQAALGKNLSMDASRSVGIGTILAVSIGSSLLVIGGAAALLMPMLKSRLSRIQRELFDTRIELAEANRSVAKLSAFVQAIETRMLEATLEPPPLASKAVGTLTGGSDGDTGAPEPGVDLMAKRTSAPRGIEALNKT
ncbi:MAG: SEL1-like repeat protein [Verrucomicrobiales bacterium]